MSTRKYAFGYEKLKKRKKEEKLIIKSQKGSMDKFVNSCGDKVPNLCTGP